jgi:phage terminase small subunit
MSNSERLTIKQNNFVAEYMKDGNASKAYRIAYDTDNMLAASIEQNACVLLKNVKVQSRIEECTENLAVRNEIDADWVIKHLKENLRRALRLTKVRDKRGRPTGEYTYQGAVANRALELIGKHLGMFVDRVEHSGKDGEAIQITYVETILDVGRESYSIGTVADNVTVVIDDDKHPWGVGNDDEIRSSTMNATNSVDVEDTQT